MVEKYENISHTLQHIHLKLDSIETSSNKQRFTIPLSTSKTIQLFPPPPLSLSLDACNIQKYYEFIYTWYGIHSFRKLSNVNFLQSGFQLSSRWPTVCFFNPAILYHSLYLFRRDQCCLEILYFHKYNKMLLFRKYSYVK